MTAGTTAPSANIYLLGDLSYPFEDDLRRLLHCKSHGALQRFFEEVSSALRQEIAKYPEPQQEWLPRFTTLIDLMGGYQGMVGEPALKSSLLCVYQIGQFMNSKANLCKSPSILLGSCTGSFAAAAIACSSNDTELIHAGVRSSLVAFRTGWHSLRTRQDIDPDTETTGTSWSMIVGLSELKALEVLRSFNAKAIFPRSSRAYLSAVAPNSVTISGPPRALALLRGSFPLKTHAIDIHGPYHAPHLYGPDEVASVLGEYGEEEVSHRLQTPVMWASTGRFAVQKDIQSMLRTAVEDSLCRHIRWDLTCSALASWLAGRKSAGPCEVLPVASNAGPMICNALRDTTSISVEISEMLNSSVKVKDSQHPSGKFDSSKIAIIGFSGRYPEAASNEELWEMLLAAKDCHRTIPEDRFDWKAHYDASGKKKNHTRVKYGCFINDPGLFDARFFNLSPREAENTDPAQRLALMTAYEAIEMAGLVTDRTPSTQRDRIGVFYGVTSDDWREVNSGQDVDTYFIPGGNRAFVPGRISYFFRLSGPSISVDTACSSSFAAIATACQYLWRGECDTSIAGGANILTNPDNFVGLDRGHFLSTTGNCNPFDDSASGYCRADAVGSVVLKRLEDAIQDQDPIFGVIAAGGASTNHCGSTVSITRPHEDDQLQLFRRILRHSNTKPSHVGYVEMHGTGTQAGDAAEMRSVVSAFAPTVGSRTLPLHLGAVKANVGHAEAASGVTALIKVLMMMQHSLIPPHRLDGVVNRNYPSDLAQRNVHIALQKTAWRREDAVDGSRMAFLNNFSAAGGNTAILLQDAPLSCSLPPHKNSGHININVDDVDGVKEDGTHLLLPVVVTGKTARAFSANVDRMIAFLEENPATSLPSLSYTTTARRNHYAFRTQVCGADISGVKQALQRVVRHENCPTATRRPQIAFAFTGQATLYSGIAKELFRYSPLFHDHLLRFDRISQRQGFASFLPLVTQNNANTSDPVVAQLAQCCVQMALFHLWTCWLGEPSAVTGHSLGEYAALYAAGVLSAADAIFLVGSRARLLVERCKQSTHSMLAIKASLSSVKDTIIRHNAAVACLNSPASLVASGLTSSMLQLSEDLTSRNIDVIALEVPFAFHSAQIEPILTDFLALADQVHYRAPTVPYLSPLLADVVVMEPGVLNASYIAQAARDCVNFQGAIETGLATKAISSTTSWLEIGIHPACSGMLKQIIGSSTTAVPTLRKDSSSWERSLSSLEALYLAGADVRWNDFHIDATKQLRVLPLPMYSWDLKNYWIQYRHNFCLTKGDDPATISGNALSEGSDRHPLVPDFLSSSVHRVLHHTTGAERSSGLFESDLLDPRLVSIVSGHKVNSAQLCPSSLYADMAVTTVKYMMRAMGAYTDEVGLDCRSMSIQRPMIVQPDGSSQKLRTESDAEWTKGEVKVSFFSIDTRGKRLVNHASCVVHIAKKEDWLKDWKRQAYFVHTRIGMLHQSVDLGEAHKVKRGMAYKLFSSLVDYSPQYQGMNQVVLASEDLEATAEVTFKVDEAGFDCNPCWIDSLGHIAGFIMNGNDSLQTKERVFINHGWESMCCAGRLQRGKTYRTYNRMQLESGNTYVGDTYVFDDQEIVAIYGGVRFQGVDRSVLDHLLPAKAKLEAASRSAVVDEAAERAATRPSQTPIRHVPRPSKPQDSVPSQLEQMRLGIRKVVADEAQLSLDDLDPFADFSELGIDSLLALTIASRLEEELNVVVSPSAFSDYPTVASLIEFLVPDDGDGYTASMPAELASTRESREESEDDSTEMSSISVDEDDDYGTRTDPGGQKDVFDIVRKVIAQETGVSIGDVTATASLDELGIDSLLALTISSVLSEQLEASVSPLLVADSKTLGDIQAALIESGQVALPTQTAPPTPPYLGLDTESHFVRNQANPKGSIDTPSMVPQAVADRLNPLSALGESHAIAEPIATSVRLQGSRQSTAKTLFLFPDGAGSATSYAFLPKISYDVTVYGLNCPWMKTPQQLRCTLEYYVAKFITEIRRRQPKGPYHFGGVSAGGILAYEAAQQLTCVGESVEKLILLDTPDPIGLENPNQRMYDFLDSMGMFGMVAAKAPPWLRPHFEAFLVLLDNYKVVPFVGSLPPRTHIIYARDGMCKDEDDPRPEIHPGDPREMLWLINNRTDFSGGGWNLLVGSGNLSTVAVHDVNHYTILQEGPKIKEISGLIAKALEG